MLYYQLWGLFPICCRSGIEVIIRPLSNYIVNSAELRPQICKSLRTAKGSLNLQPYEKNFGPALFNVFLTSGSTDVLKLVDSIPFSPEFLDGKTKKVIEKILVFRSSEPA
jgi:hypothetical protein